MITAEDKTLTAGTVFDPKKDVTAADAEDGDLTDRIEVIYNTVDTSKAGIIGEESRPGQNSIEDLSGPHSSQCGLFL